MRKPLLSLLILCSVALVISLRAQTTPPRAPGNTRAAVTAAERFLASLDATQKPHASYAFDDKIKSDWHNLPPNMHARAGIAFRDLTPVQQDLGRAVLTSVLSDYGYQKVQKIMAADDYLGREWGAGFPTGPTAYMLAIYGTPSLSQPWSVQFNGHHLGINVAMAAPDNVLTPTLTAAYPNIYDDHGKAVFVLEDEATRALKLIQALNPAQQEKAIQKTQVWDFLLGPGHDGEVLQPEGVKGFDMTAAQKELLLSTAAAWVNISDSASAQAKMAELRRNVNDTYFLWSGSTTTAGDAYFRIQGPTAWIEYSPQTVGGPGSARRGGQPGAAPGGAPAGPRGDGQGARGRGNFDAVLNSPDRKLDPVHVHTVYRDFTNDYGRRFYAATR